MGLGRACLLAAEDRDLALGPRPPRVAHAVACRAVERHRTRRCLGGGEAAPMPGAAAVAQAAVLDVAGGAAEALVAAARSGHACAVPAAHLAHLAHCARRRGAVGAAPAAFARAAAQRARAVARAVGLARELRAPCLEEGEGEGHGER